MKYRIFQRTVTKSRQFYDNRRIKMADKTSRDYVICPCRGVTRGEVEDAIRKNRITDLKVLCQTTNAGTKCGGCREDLEKLIHEILGN